MAISLLFHYGSRVDCSTRFDPGRRQIVAIEIIDGFTLWRPFARASDGGGATPAAIAALNQTRRGVNAFAPFGAL
jgi:hypothetical protein